VGDRGTNPGDSGFVLAILGKDKDQPTRRLHPRGSFRCVGGELGRKSAVLRSIPLGAAVPYSAVSLRLRRSSDRILCALRDHQGVAKIDFFSGFAADQHIDVPLLHAQKLSLLFTRRFFNHPLVGLFDHGGYQGEHLIDSCDDRVCLHLAVPGALPARFQTVTVTFGVVADRPDQGLDFSKNRLSSLLPEPPSPFYGVELFNVTSNISYHTKPWDKTVRLQLNINNLLNEDGTFEL